MRRGALAVLLLGACAPETPPVAGPTYRDTDRVIASSLRFDAVAVQGAWQVVAGFDDCPDGAAFAQAPAGMIAAQLCGLSGLYNVIGPGRLHPVEDGTAIWFLWLSEDLSTAAVGTPDGRFGWVLNRGPAIRADRLTAATELLDFNGYDVTRLRRLAQ